MIWIKCMKSERKIQNIIKLLINILLRNCVYEFEYR